MTTKSSSIKPKSTSTSPTPTLHTNEASTKTLTALSGNTCPKGLHFNQITPEQLAKIVQEINNRPRKGLGYKTPQQVFQDCLK